MPSKAHPNPSKDAASELRNLVSVLQCEHAELEDKFNTYLDTVTLRVMDKIGSLEFAVNQKFEEQLLQSCPPEPTSADQVQNSFKVVLLSLTKAVWSDEFWFSPK